MADDDEWLCSSISLNGQWSLPISSARPPHSGLDLHIIRQPEERHRARYLSEGSRGAIKDRSGSSHCTVQLIGYHRPARLEIFAAKLDGTTPHPNYSTINVGGRGGGGTTPCRKLNSTDGVECVEVVLRPENDMIALLDCVGLLKMCSNGGGSRKRDKMAHNTSSGTVSHAQNSVRLVFKAYVEPPLEGLTEDDFNPHSAKNHIVIQRASEPILCVQQLGSPEVLKMSTSSCSTRGGDELFLIGRNFDKDARVIFREYNEDGSLKWSSNGHIDRQYHHQCHIVVSIPEYPYVSGSKNVSVCVACGSKTSHPMTFHYTAPSSPRPRHDARVDEDDWRPPDITFVAPARRFSNEADARPHERLHYLASKTPGYRDNIQGRRGVKSPTRCPLSPSSTCWPSSSRVRYMPYCLAPSHSSTTISANTTWYDDCDEWAPPQADI